MLGAAGAAGARAAGAGAAGAGAWTVTVVTGGRRRAAAADEQQDSGCAGDKGQGGAVPHAVQWPFDHG